MKEKESWFPTKYIYKNGKLIGSRDKRYVAVGSRLISDLIAEYYSDNIKLYVSGKLLDLGCGNIPLYIAYKNYITENICVDWQDSLHKNHHIDFYCDLTQRLPFEDAEFDTVILSDVLEHIPNPENIVYEIHRVLKKNGKLFLNVPFYYWIHEEPYDFYRYTEFALKHLLEHAGLKIIKLEIIGGVIEVITDIISKNITRIPIIGDLPAIFLQWSTLHFSKRSIGKYIKGRTSLKFPYGYFIISEK